MLSNDEVRERFFDSTKLIDRHGSFVYLPYALNQTRDGFTTLLHYHLLDGVSDASALKTLAKYGLSSFEAKFTLNAAKNFINDVLGLPLEEIRTSTNSTEGVLWRNLNKVLIKTTEVFTAKENADILFDGHMFQADPVSRQTIGEYISHGKEDSYEWNDRSNVPVTLSKERLSELLSAINERNSKLKEERLQYKSRLRSAAEKNDFDAVSALELELDKL